MEIAFYSILVGVGVAIFTTLGALWYRSGRAVTRTELDAALDRIDARFNRNEELITNNANQLRAELVADRAAFLAELAKNRTEMRQDMAAGRAELLAEMAKNRDEMRQDMAAGRAELLAELAKNRNEMRQDLRQAVIDLTQAIANHQHDPDGRVSVVMVAEPQSGYETNRPTGQ